MPRSVRAAIVAAHEALHLSDIVDRSRDDSFGLIFGRWMVFTAPSPHYNGLSLTVKMIAIWRKPASINPLPQGEVGG